MTPKEQAKELVNSYLPIHIPLPIGSTQKAVSVSMDWQTAKECALVACRYFIEYKATAPFPYEIDSVYYEEVKTEIEKL